MKMAAIYTRVSSERQREAHTIASQTAALVEWATTLDLEVPRDWIFEDDGYSGATLEWPGLERVRDLAAGGDIEVVLVHSPDRLSRKYAYQVLLIEELGRHGVETRFLNAPSSATAEDQLLVQFQGMIVGRLIGHRDLGRLSYFAFAKLFGVGALLSARCAAVLVLAVLP